ncbi:MAG: hypothetical protein WBG73_06510 [Coleofasciculaceae cyanobacterium]
MVVSWEVKSSWLSVGITRRGAFICFYLFGNNISVFWGNVRSDG